MRWEQPENTTTTYVGFALNAWKKDINFLRSIRNETDKNNATTTKTATRWMIFEMNLCFLTLSNIDERGVEWWKWTKNKLTIRSYFWFGWIWKTVRFPLFMRACRYTIIHTTPSNIRRRTVIWVCVRRRFWVRCIFSPSTFRHHWFQIIFFFFLN